MQFAAQTSRAGEMDEQQKKAAGGMAIHAAAAPAGAQRRSHYFAGAFRKAAGFFVLTIHQYRGALTTKEMKSYSALLDSFYAERDLMDRMKQKSHDLLRLLANTSDRIARKIAAQEQELKECANRERLKISDLIQANLYQMEKGQSVLRVPNFYEEGLPLVDIVLIQP